jgi:hypothetical protein
VEVAWKDIYLGKDGDYRIGVRFVDISAEDMDKLKTFLNTLKNSKPPSALKSLLELNQSSPTVPSLFPSSKN